MLLNRLRHAPDAWAGLALVGLWILFFWRLFTPVEIDALSLEEGDFSGQFVSWTSYAVERIGDGEIPLWNPYMHAGTPFLADPQTAVLYPPRLATVAILAIGGQTSGSAVFRALQTEMTVHVLLGVFLMYAFLRRVTGDILRRHAVASVLPSVFASLAGALVFGFGGYMTAYPQLQLPILETAIWAPLVLLGIHEATRTDNESLGWMCIVLSGVGFALAVLAGHPQTYFLVGYLAAAYLVVRGARFGWQQLILALVLFAVVAGGLSAAQWLPGYDFQRQTYRDDLGFADKGGGFAFHELVQIIFPAMLGTWSPLYLSVIGLVLVVIAVWRQGTASRFWIAVAGVALIASFGQHTALYSAIYLLLPGANLFRGQERAAVLFTVAAAVLIALGALHLLTWGLSPQALRRFQRLGIVGLAAVAVLSAAFFVLYLVHPDAPRYFDLLQPPIFALLVFGGSLLFIPWLVQRPRDYWRGIALIAFIAFDLFTLNAQHNNYEAIAASERLPEPVYIDVIQENLAAGQRVEGLRGIRQSYGALYRVPDIWGNSPLRLEAIEYYLWQIPIERRWELLAVEVVNSEWAEVPGAHDLVGQGVDDEGAFNIFRLLDPRPFAHMVYEVRIADEDNTRQLVADPSFPLREIVILAESPGALPEQPGNASVDLDVFEPEYIEIYVETDAPGVLSLALPFERGWQASINGNDASIRKAYGGLSAVWLDSGSHKIVLQYRPMTFFVGAAISLITLLGVVVALGVALSRRQRMHDEENNA
ncbi:MAG: YfhO family protein [Chloroflexi bacterium]|nr:YfhO family protein [Chloroflexota bacterium]